MLLRCELCCFCVSRRITFSSAKPADKSLVPSLFSGKAYRTFACDRHHFRWPAQIDDLRGLSFTGTSACIHLTPDWTNALLAWLSVVFPVVQTQFGSPVIKHASCPWNVVKFLPSCPQELVSESVLCEKRAQLCLLKLWTARITGWFNRFWFVRVIIWTTARSLKIDPAPGSVESLWVFSRLNSCSKNWACEI